MDKSKTNIASLIEAILFWQASPVSKKKLAEYIGVDLQSIDNGINDLRQILGEGRGLTMIETDDEVALGTAKEHSDLIKKLARDELSTDLGRAGLETLSIILYQNPISRAEIDYIRGVNSQFILRTLLVRGLVERMSSPDDARIFLYKPTLDLLANLGISKIDDLPQYKSIRQEIDGLKKQSLEAKETGPMTNIENDSQNKNNVTTNKKD